jgi:hypothetical protein
MSNGHSEVSGESLPQVVPDASAHIVGYGVDTLVLNVRYTNVDGKPVKQELDERYVTVLNEWQEKARLAEESVPIPLSFRGVSFLMHPHGAGKGQWRWLLTSSLLSLTIGRGRLNGIVAQVRCSSEYLWSCESFADAVIEVTFFLYQFFGDHLFIQVSEVHLCADVVGWDVSSCGWQSSFLSRARRRVDRAATSDETVAGGAAVAVVSGRRLATLEFGARGPLSCSIYNKTLEIKQKSRKTWFYDFWRKNGWDGESEVWRVEFRYRREALHEVGVPGVFEGIEDVYDLVERLEALWVYAAGHVAGGPDGLPDGWLRYVVPGSDRNRARWEVHPAWAVIQQAFTDDASIARDEDGNILVDEDGVVQMCTPAQVIRTRKRQVNIKRGVQAIVGYCSTLSAWLTGQGDGEQLPEVRDFEEVLRWLRDLTPCILRADASAFVEDVYRKRLVYGLDAA